MEQSINPPRRLYRSTTNRIIAGICGGLADYFSIDVTLVRLIFVAMTLGGGFGIGLYILLWILIPEQGKEGQTQKVEERMKEFGNEVRSGAERLADDFKNGKAHESRRMWIAALIILLGIGLLMNQFMPWSWFHWDTFWPMVLIVVGVYLMVKR